MTYKNIFRKKTGVILVTTLWILLILTIFSLAMSRSVRLDLLLSGYGIDKLKSYYAAKAGVVFTVTELNKGQDNYDSLYKCGIILAEGTTPESLFKDIKVGDSLFTIGYPLIDDENKIAYGLEDEEKRINLNAVDKLNYQVLSSLLKLKGVEPETALIVTSSVVDWLDSDSEVFNPPNGAEDAYYSGLGAPYHCQNMNFASPEELLLVRGMSQEIFGKIKDYITIFPLQPQQPNGLKVNFNTATEVVLQALANSAVEKFPSVYLQSDADSLVQKIIEYRKGEDDIIATVDDRFVTQAELGSLPDKLDLVTGEKILLIYLSNYFFVAQSQHYRINALGMFKDRKVRSKIVAIFRKTEATPLFWHED